LPFSHLAGRNAAAALEPGPPIPSCVGGKAVIEC